jgi:hypothetical protein
MSTVDDRNREKGGLERGEVERGGRGREREGVARVNG